MNVGPFHEYIDSLGDVQFPDNYVHAYQLDPDEYTALVAAVIAMDTSTAGYTEQIGSGNHGIPHWTTMTVIGPSGKESLVYSAQESLGARNSKFSNDPAAAVILQYKCGDV